MSERQRSVDDDMLAIVRNKKNLASTKEDRASPRNMGEVWAFGGVHGENDMTWGREVLFPANPDLADILGDVDLDFENFHFVCLLGFQISKSRFPDFRNLGRAGLGPWAQRSVDYDMLAIVRIKEIIYHIRPD